MAELCNEEINDTHILAVEGDWSLRVGEPWGAWRVVIVRDKWQPRPGGGHGQVPARGPFLPSVPGTFTQSGVVVNYSELYDYLRRMQCCMILPRAEKMCPTAK